jgi:hypothetical protein
MNEHTMSVRKASGNCEVWRCYDCNRILVVDLRRIGPDCITVMKRGNNSIEHHVGLTDDDQKWIANLDIDWD